MVFEFKLAHKFLALVTIPVVFALVFLLVMMQLQRQTEVAERAIAHSVEIQNRIAKIMDDNERINQTFAKTYETRNYFGLRSLRKQSEQLSYEVEALRQLTAADPLERSRFARSFTMVDNYQRDARAMGHAVMASMKSMMFGRVAGSGPGLAGLAGLGLGSGATPGSGGPAAPPDWLRTPEVHNLMDNLQDLRDEMYRIGLEETKLQHSALATAASCRHLEVNSFFAGLTINVLLSLYLAFFFYRQFIGRLAVMSDNAQRIAKNQQLRPPLSGLDELAQLDKSFHHMDQALKKADEMKREFMALITHDLRAPLTSVHATLSLLEMGALGDLSEKADRSTRQALGASNLMIGLVNDLLDVHRLESAELLLEYSEVKIDAVVASAVGAIQAIADQKQITISPTVTDTTLEVDSSRITRVLVNLISNAIKFSPKGSTVAVNIECTNDRLVARIVDKGRGIPAADRERIFTKFAQVDTTDSSIKGGTGLGLTICQEIIKAHRGTIGVESVEGEGSTFWFSIPLKPGSPTAS